MEGDCDSDIEIDNRRCNLVGNMGDLKVLSNGKVVNAKGQFPIYSVNYDVVVETGNRIGQVAVCSLNPAFDLDVEDLCRVFGVGGVKFRISLGCGLFAWEDGKIIHYTKSLPRNSKVWCRYAAHVGPIGASKNFIWVGIMQMVVSKAAPKFKYTVIHA